MKKIKPLFKNVLIKKLKYVAPSAATSVGGIIIPESESYEDVKIGEVIEIGEDVEIELEKGMVVLLPNFGGTEFNYDGDNLAIYHVESLIGVVKEEGDI